MTRSKSISCLAMCIFTTVYILIVCTATVALSEPDNTTRAAASCGPYSLWYACLSLGVPADLNALIKEQRELPDGGKNGCSFADLQAMAHQQGLIAKGMRCSWTYLETNPCVAILHVRNNHFICIDSRKRKVESTGTVLSYYDPADHEKSDYINAKSLGEIWDGATLILTRDRDDNPIAFDSLIHDFGTADMVTSYTPPH